MSKRFSWFPNDMLSRLGFRAKDRKPLQLKNRGMRFEPLEQRQMLSLTQVIDDDALGFDSTSGWWSASNPAGYEGDWRATSPGTGAETETATWTFETLDPAKSYQLFATWGEHENRATNAPYSIYDGAALQATYRFNQQYAPDDDTFDGQGWESLGVFTPSSGTLVVELSNDVDGYVLADAIRLEEVVPPTEPLGIIDDGDAGFAQSDGWWNASWPAGYEGDWRATGTGTGTETATWTFEALDPAKDYQVLATWGAHANRATNVPYSIYDGTALQATYRFNQQYAPDDDTFDGQEWESLGVYDISSGTLVVELSDDVDGYVIADAIRLVEVIPPTEPPEIIDDGDVGFAQTEGWWNASWPAGYEGDWRATGVGSGSEAATWTFEALDPAKNYQVFATWGAYENRATNAPYSIYDGMNLEVTYRFNQQYAPDDDNFDGQGWESLGVYSISSGTLVVELTNDANGYVIADAIRLVEVVSPTEPAEIIDDGDAGFAQTEGWWNASWPPAGYEDDWRATGVGDGSEVASWTFEPIVSGSTVEVLATWGEHSNRASNAPYTLYDGGVPETKVMIDQRLAPSGGVYDGEPWESLGSYVIDSGTLVVELSDDVDGYVIADAVRIIISSPTNTPPVFTSPSTVDVPENTTAVITVEAMDADLPVETVTYSITGGDDQTLFSINETTGELVFQTSPSFEAPDDANSDNDYQVDITADDGNGGTTVQSIVVTVTDLNEAPTAIGLSSNDVDENRPVGTVVGTFSSADEDTGDTFIYTLVTGSGGSGNSSFQIVGSELRTNAVFDYESQSTYSIRVRTTDSGTLPYEKVFTIDVNDLNEAPADIALSADTVVENTDTSTGHVVGALSGTDPDTTAPFNTLAFTIVGGADAGVFSVDGADNLVLTDGVLDFETSTDANGDGVYEATVRVTDGGSLSYDESFTVAVTNLNEAPTDIGLSSNDVDENAMVGTLVGTFSSADPDAGETFTYSLVAGDGDSGNGSFQIVGSDLRTKAVFDYETQSSYSIRVRTVDLDGLLYEEVFTIDVNDVFELPIDIAISGFEAGGGNLIVQYSIMDVEVSAFTVGIYHTFDDVAPYDPGTPLTTYRVDNPSDLQVGSHSLSIAPDFDYDLPDGEFSLMAMVDAYSEVVEDDETNNLLAIGSGALQLADQTVYAFGTTDNDLVTVAAGSVEITINSTTHTYADSVPKIVIQGRAGNDQITVGAGITIPVTVYGSTGDDTITGGSGPDSLYGGEGQDSIYGEAGNDLLYGGGDSDLIKGGYGDDCIDGGSGSDTGVLGDTIEGGSGNDVIYGTEKNDLIQGGSGDDYIFGLDGVDTIDGGSQDDYIDGGSGNDWLYGKTGYDMIKGGPDDDHIYGGDEGDALEGGDGIDIIDGGLGNDWIDGGAGNDTLTGNSGNDIIYGGEGDDYIDGDDGHDDLYGEGGGDTLSGGIGHDFLDGGDDIDAIEGDADLDSPEIIDEGTPYGGWALLTDPNAYDEDYQYYAGDNDPPWDWDKMVWGVGDHSEPIPEGTQVDVYVASWIGTDSFDIYDDSSPLATGVTGSGSYSKHDYDWAKLGDTYTINSGLIRVELPVEEGEEADADAVMFIPKWATIDLYVDSLDDHTELMGPGRILGIGETNLTYTTVGLNDAGYDLSGRNVTFSTTNDSLIRLWKGSGMSDEILLNTPIPRSEAEYIYIEALAPGTLQLSVSIDDVVERPVFDTVRLTIPEVDLDVDSNNDGTIDPDDSVTGTDDPIEYDSPGKYVLWNTDDDNANGVPDWEEYEQVAKEDELIPMELWAAVPPQVASGWTASLESDSGLSYVKVWDSPDKSNELDLYSVSWDFDKFGVVSDTVWIEGVNIGTEQLELVLYDGSNTWLEDRLQVTVIEAPTLTIAATDAYASEGGGDDGVFTISRGEGNTTGDLVVNYQVDTSTENGAVATDPSLPYPADYWVSEQSLISDLMTMTGSVTIPDGQSNVTLTIVPSDDSIKEWDESITITVTDVVPSTPDETALIDRSHDTATVTILDDDQIGGFVKRNIDTETTGETEEVISNGTINVGIQEGHVRLEPFMAIDAFTPSYRGDDNLYPIVSVEMPLPGYEAGTTSIPGEIEATLTFGGVECKPITFDTSAVSSTYDVLRFAVIGLGLNGDDEITNTLDTGHYEYDVRFVAEIDGNTLTRTIRGSTELVNLVNDENQFGNRHWIDSLDRLVPGDGTDTHLADQGLAVDNGMALMRGDNTSAWYESQFTNSTIIDTWDSGYSEWGSWTDGTHSAWDSWGYDYAAAGHNNDYRYCIDDSSSGASWTFSNVDPGRQYQVFVTWVPDADRADNILYQINGAAQVRDPYGATEVYVDQRFTPGELVYEGVQWRSLGYYTVGEGNSELSVNLDSSYVGTFNGRKLVADAVMLVDDWDYTTPADGFTTLEHGDLSSPISGYDPQAGDYTLLGTYGNRYEFDDQGLLARHVDRNQNRIEFAYDDGLELTGITLQGGLHYTVSGYSVTDYAGRALYYPGSPEYDYNTGLMTAYTDAEGNRTVINYDSDTHRVTSVDNADTFSWEITPFLTDGLNGLTGTVRRPADNAMIGQREQSASGYDPDATFVEARATYTDPRTSDPDASSDSDYEWTYQTDHYGHITAMANPAPYEDVWRWVRNDSGQLLDSYEPAGGGGIDTITTEIRTHYVYDFSNSLTRPTYIYHDYQDPLTFLDSDYWLYGLFNQVVSYTGFGRALDYVLDTFGNLDVQTESTRETKYVYTPAPTSVEDMPGGLLIDATVGFGTDDAVTTHTDYYTPSDGNSVGLPETVKFNYIASPESHDASIEYTFDSYRNPSTFTDEMGRFTMYVYTDRNLLHSVMLPDPGDNHGITDHAAPITVYDYDGFDNLEAVTDAHNNKTDYYYDAMNRLEEVKLPSADGLQPRLTTSYEYYANGTLKQVTTPATYIAYTYDARNYTTQIKQPAPGITAPAGVTTLASDVFAAPVTTYEHDALGNVKSMTDPLNNITQYAYGRTHQITRIVDPAAAGQHDAPVTTFVLEHGQVTETHSPGPDGPRISTVLYNEFRQVAGSIMPAGVAGAPTAGTGFDGRGNAVTNTSIDRTSQTVLDASNRVIQTNTHSSRFGGPSLQTNVTRNDDGRVATTTVAPSDGSLPGRTTTNAYDNLGRPIDVTRSAPDLGASQLAPNYVYHYDAVGNTLSSINNISAGETAITVNQFDNLNRIWAVTNPLLTGGYDPLAPAPPDKHSFEYVFNTAGQLGTFREGVEDTGTEIRFRDTTYEYDNLGRLYKVTEPLASASSDPKITYFFHDAVGNLRYVIENPTMAITENQFDELNRQVVTIDPDPDGAAGPLLAPEWQTAYDIADQVTLTIDADGNETSHAYDALGNPLSQTLPQVGGQTPVSSTMYDIYGNAVSRTDVQGDTSESVLDRLGRQIYSIEPLDGGDDQTLDDPAATLVGDWSDPVSNADALGGSYRYIDDDPAATADWTFTVTPGKRYMVLATWVADAANADAAAYTVLDGTTELGTFTVDQQYAPTGRLLDGQNWNILELVTVETAGADNLTVRLAGVAGARVAADAVRIREVGATTASQYNTFGETTQITSPTGEVSRFQYDLLGRQTRSIQGAVGSFFEQTQNDTDAVFNGWWIYDDTQEGAVDGDSHAATAGSTTAVWTVAGLDPDKQYLVFTSWLPFASAIDVPFNLYDGSTAGTLLESVTVDQTALQPDAVLGYHAWQLLSVVTAASGTLAVELDATGAVGAVTADAIRIVEAVPATYTTYNARGDVVATLDGLGNRTTYAYDAVGRQTSVTDANDATTSYTYDLLGRQTSVTDPVGNTTSFVYDDRDRLVAETVTIDTIEYARSFEYSTSGDRTRAVDREGRVRNYEYDALHRVTTETWYANVADADAEQNVLNTISTTYDILSRLDTVSDDNSDYDYDYDVLDRVTSITSNNIGAPTVVQTIGYGTRLDGLRTSVAATIDGVADFITTYDYNERDELTRIEQTGQTGGNAVADKRIDLVYDNLGRADLITRYADLAGTQLVAETDFVYDELARLTDLTHAQGATILADYGWTFDAAGRLIQQTSPDGVADYDYDPTGQLTGADYDYQSDESYIYDANGNRITANGDSYTTGGNNRLDSDGTYDYQYDLEGNRTKRTEIATGAVTDYEWDNDNRLIRVTERDTDGGPATKIVEYAYDQQNRWIRKSVDPDGDGPATLEGTIFVYDGNQIVAQLDDAGAITNRYLWGPAVDQILADEQVTSPTTPGEVVWPLTDHLNTVRDLAMSDASGDTVIVNHRTFNAFGLITAEEFFDLAGAPILPTNPEAIRSLLAFTARPYDPLTRLQNNLHRWYDLSIGRWVSEDWIGFSAGDMNLYRYVRNSSTIGTDPTGEMWPPTTTAESMYEVCDSSPSAATVNAVATTKLLLHAKMATLINKHRGKTYTKDYPNGVYHDGVLVSPSVRKSGLIDALQKLDEQIDRIGLTMMTKSEYANSINMASYRIWANKLKVPASPLTYLVSSRTLMHELVHALDDANNWYFRKAGLVGLLGYWTGGGNYSGAEGLAYAMEHLEEGAQLLGKVDDAIDNHEPFAKVEKNWNEAWDHFRDFGAVKDQVVYLECERPLMKSDFGAAKDLLGVRFSAHGLAHLYNKKMFDSNYPHGGALVAPKDLPLIFR